MTQGRKSKKAGVGSSHKQQDVTASAKSNATACRQGTNSEDENLANGMQQTSPNSAAAGPIRDLLIAIGLLYMLNEHPSLPLLEQPSSLLEKSDKDVHGRMLSFSDEERLTGAFCFLASTTKDPRKISALCLEESVNSASLTIRIAANWGDLSRVTDGLRKLIAIMKTAKQASQGETADRMLEAAVSMNQNRILCRMRSSHAKWDSNFAKVWSSKPALLPQFLNVIEKSLPEHHLELVCKDLLQIRNLTNSLETLEAAEVRSHQGVVLLAQILKAVNRLCSSTYLWDIYPTCLSSHVKKLGHYVSVSLYLLEQARFKHILSTLTVEIVRFQPLRSGDDVPSLGDLQSLFTFTDSRAVTLQVLKCLNPSRAQTAHNDQSKVVLGRVGEIMRNKSPVHAEIQLLIYYELNSSPLPPRIIHSTKKPCFLCSLFFSLHGKFRIPATHGRLYEKWTLPVDIAKLQGPQALYFGLKLAAFKEALVRSILECAASTSRKCSGPAISSESFYLELPSQAFQIPVRKALEKPITKTSTTSLDRHHSTLEVVHHEEHTTDHSKCQIQYFPNEGGTIGLEVSNSTGAGSTTSKKIFDRSVSACSGRILDLTKANRSSRMLCSPRADHSTTERKGRQEAPPLPCSSEKALCVQTSLDGSDVTQANHEEDIQRLALFRRQRQSEHIRSLTDLDLEQQRAARVIKDHESRTRSTSFVRGMSEARRWGLNMPHTNGKSRTIDFHEMELSLNIEHPTTAQLIVLRSSGPQNRHLWPIIDVDELRVGEDVVVDTGLNQASSRKLFLVNRNTKGAKYWCECIWKCGGQKDSVN